MKNIEKEILDIFNKTGPLTYYKGFDQLKYCVGMVMEDESKLYCLKKEVYPIIGEKTYSNPRCIERNIRILINNMDLVLFSDIIGVKVDKLTPKMLVKLLVNYLKYKT